MKVETTELLLIGGRSGAGKSAVGYELHHHLAKREVTHGLIEGDNLDLAYPPPWEYGLAETNLHVIWRNYRGPRPSPADLYQYVERSFWRSARCGPRRSRARHRCAAHGLRRSGSSPPIRARSCIRTWATRASQPRASGVVDRLCPEWVNRIATDDRPVTDTAREIASVTGWT